MAQPSGPHIRCAVAETFTRQGRSLEGNLRNKVSSGASAGLTL